MLAIPLAQVPNQASAFNADNVLWNIHVYQSAAFMCADISVNGTPVMNAVRCFGGIPLLQYGYMRAAGLGNFVFDSDADWTNFGSTCNLYYLNQTELAEFEAALA